jgi:nucleoside-diphosphate-sugar epimerase
VSASILRDPQAWTGIRVLVTGVPGFNASQLVSRLTCWGADVHAVSRRRGPGPQGPDSHVADPSDSHACVDLVRTIARYVVFHSASAVTWGRDVDLVVPLIAANQAEATNVLTAPAKSVPMLPGSIEEPHQSDDLTPYAAAKSRRRLMPGSSPGCGTCE